MTTSYFCSDLHFGHKNIGKFRAYLGLDTEEKNRNKIKEDWISLVTKRDRVYVLGDAAFTMDTVSDFQDLPGEKILIRGNHDELDTQVYLKYFTHVFGIKKYKEFWLTHAPIHPNELRNRINLHGHVHQATIPDPYYFNCCPENLLPNFGKCLVSLDDIRKHFK